ncbi:MAG: nitroreductase family deazaflavin-dependent oxidoreductase [Anaerolineales bacterium]|nr:nitroreductase family deazaflavin-dependent oxidoreductase [Anaerolineales bacterium]
MIKTFVFSPLHPLLGESFAVITVYGSKTGRRISTPINVSHSREEFTVVSYRTRTWWRNLREGRAGGLRLGGKTVTVTAKIIDDPEQGRDGLRVYFERHPGYAEYSRSGRMPWDGSRRTT